ncbi:TonB-dependent receptor [Flavobacterium silvisoli]|uniref:TonB-dependent receptor n=1 Tax=Flavobacterium silvisoli TaxID=2529433 RepID=A0A4Q9Z360_9FLAO|nr:TonB-dependent receptor [Flavobacterium silvisoli]TBX70660.1 TonB-dependent receptor [Flavobacterium silvisoli]
MKFKLIVIFLFLTVISLAQSKGTVTGILTDRELNNEPLPFANVLIKGTSRAVVTDETGKYTISIEPGTYTIQFSFLGYENIEEKIEVKAGETLTLNKALGSGSYQLQDVVIQNTTSREKETALLLEQKKAVEIKQSIGAQEMSRKGVSDVEEGLTKITGITKVGSRGLFVRGLEDRYNNLLINNLAVPSNNPFKKIIPLDLIPTDVVSIIETYKTFNPNIYGDFAGATFNLVTLTKPTKSITKVTVGAGYTTNNNLSDFYTSPNVNTTKGFFGFSGSDRNLPSVFGSQPYPPVTLSSSGAVNNFKSGFDIEKSKSPLNTSLGFLHAEKFNIKEAKFSYLLSLNFDNSYTFRTGADRTLQAGNSIEYSNNFRKTTYDYKTNISSIIGLNYSTDRLNLSSTLLYLKSTDSQIQDQLGYQNNQKDVTNYLIRTNQLDESDYLNGQLFGEYQLTSDKKHSVKAGGSLAKTAYNQPDRNSYTGSQVSETEINTSYGGNNFLRQYLDIKSKLFSSAFFEYNYQFGKDHKLSIGYNGNHNFTVSKYRFIQTIIDPNNTGSTNFVMNPFEIDSQITADLLAYKIDYQESSNANWKAKLDETINAGYANLFYKFSEKFDMNAGIRFENYDRLTKYKEIGSWDQKYKKRKSSDLYFLPSINVRYALTDKSNLRFASSLTYTKPVIMESFPISLVNPDGTVFQGNPFIENSKNINVDFKYEVFPTSKEMLAVGVFGKSIDKPIERTFVANPGTTILSFLNSDKATLYGVEAEVILDLTRISDALKDFSWGFNTSIMQTKVTVPSTVISPSGDLSQSIETHKTRELQGASKWLINSDLKYQFDMNKNWSNTISAVYSVFGKRIYSVGTAGIDHIYELPVSKLDLVWTSKISEHFDLKLSADNILNPSTKLEVGKNSKDTFIESSRIIQDYKKGVGFSFSLGYTF